MLNIIIGAFGITGIVLLTIIAIYLLYVFIRDMLGILRGRT